MSNELNQIEAATKAYADAREALNELVSIVNRQLDEVYRASIKDVKRTLAKVIERQAALNTLIETNPDLFEKPRTQVFHGIKVGYRKGKGGITWEDDEQVVKLIKKHFDEQKDVLIRVEESPIKAALEEMSVADLKRLGITVEDTGDQVVIKPVDSAVEKTVKALLASANKEMKEAA